MRRRAGTGPVGVMTSSTIARAQPTPRVRWATDRAARRRDLAPLAQAQARALPRADATHGRDDASSTSASTRSRYGESGGEGGCTTHNFLEEALPVAARITALGLHDGARFRARYPEIRVRAGRRVRAPVRRRRVRRRPLERGDRARRSTSERQEALRPRGAARRQARLPDDAEPLVPGRGAHAAPARALAPVGRRRTGVRPRREALGEGEPPPRRRPTCARCFPAPVRVRQPRHDARRDRRDAPAFARVALVVLVVGLALHNLAMALLWQAGVRDTALDVAAAWKESCWSSPSSPRSAAAGSLPQLVWADRLALAYGALVVLYWLLPQSWLDGERDGQGRAVRAPPPPAPARRLRARAASSRSTGSGGAGSG